MYETILNSLNWAAANEINCQVTVRDGVLSVTASRENISADYAIEEWTTVSIGRAFLIAIDSVKHGTMFHQTHGFMPDPDKLNPGV